MGTKVQAKAFLPEYHSVIDHDGDTRNGMRSLFHDNQIARNGEDPESVTSLMYKNGSLGYAKENVRQTILRHESIFRSQVQELHRLYRRQQDLMNEIKSGANKDDGNDENSQSISMYSSITRNAPHSSSLHHLSTPDTTFKLSPSFVEDKSIISSNRAYDLGISSDAYISTMDKQIPDRISKLSGVGSTFRNMNHHTSYNRDSKSSATAVRTPQDNADALKFDMYIKRNSNPADLKIANAPDEMSDSLMLAKGDLSMSSSSNSHFVSKDLFQNSYDGMNRKSSFISSGLMNVRNRNEHLCADYSERQKIDDHSAIGDFCSGKSLTFSESLMAETRNGSSSSPFETGKSLSRKKRTIFGVEISEENDDSLCTRESTPLNQIVRSNLESRRISTSEPFSWIASPLVQTFELSRGNVDHGNNVRSKADEISCETTLSDQSKMNGKWLQGCSSIGLNLVEGPRPSAEGDSSNFFKNLDMSLKPAEVLERGLEHSQKLPQHQSKLENPRGGLPWFLKKPQHVEEPSKGPESSYFMNVDSLQSFLRKSEIANCSFQNSKQKKEISAQVAIQDDEVGINEVNNGTFVKKILGFPISGMHQSLNDLSPAENFSKVNCSSSNSDSVGKFRKNENDTGNQFETKNYSSDPKHHFDLNLSLDEDESPSPPSSLTAIVKIPTNEINLECPTVIQSKEYTSSQEANSGKKLLFQGESEIIYEECDKNAAEAILALSSSGEKHWVNNDDSLKWFAEIVSSQCDDTVEVTLDQNRARDEESSIPTGMDFFEFMTLKLEDNKELHYSYNPVVSKNPINEETQDATFPKRARRGQSRRGRQRNDFQRDILPGIVTLSRHEMNEDIRTFKELSKPESSTRNSSQQNSTRNGRGKKRLGGPTTSPPRKARCVTQTEPQPVCRQLELEEKSFTGWGKRTRRVPRQRVPNAYLSFPVKC